MLASAIPISRGPAGVFATMGPPLSPEQTVRWTRRCFNLLFASAFSSASRTPCRRACLNRRPGTAASRRTSLRHWRRSATRSAACGVLWGSDFRNLRPRGRRRAACRRVLGRARGLDRRRRGRRPEGQDGEIVFDPMVVSGREARRRDEAGLTAAKSGCRVRPHQSSSRGCRHSELRSAPSSMR